MENLKISILIFNARIPLVFLLGFFITEVFSEKCAYKPCGKDPHTMCRYPAELDKSQPNCTSKESIAGLNQDNQKAILNKHNQLRQTIAQGKAKQPEAANMMKLKWDKELEEIAQRFVNSCPAPFGPGPESNLFFSSPHDTCRHKKDGTSVGQNSGSHMFGYVKAKPNKTNIIFEIVDQWYNKLKYMQSNYVDDMSLVKDDIGKIGEYTQLMWAKTDRVGCGYLEYDQHDPVQFALLVCNYAPTGNVMSPGNPVYLRGEPCSKCPEGTHCSGSYPGLCTAEVGDKGTGFSNPTFGGASWGVILVFIIRCLM